MKKFNDENKKGKESLIFPTSSTSSQSKSTSSVFKSKNPNFLQKPSFSSFFEGAHAKKGDKPYIISNEKQKKKKINKYEKAFKDQKKSFKKAKLKKKEKKIKKNKEK